MVVLRSLLAASLASTAFAGNFLDIFRKRQDQCNGSIQEYLGGSYCCPGIILDDSDATNADNAYCCVGGSGVHIPIPLITTAGGASQVGGLSAFSTGIGAITTAPGPVSISTTLLPGSTKPSCKTTVMLTDSDYSSKINAAGSSIGASATSGSTKPAGVTASTTSAADSTTTTATDGTTVLTGSRSSSSTMGSSGTTSLTSSGTAASASGSSSSSSSSTGSGNAAPMITAAPVAGALALAGGMLVAAL